MPVSNLWHLWEIRNMVPNSEAEAIDRYAWDALEGVGVRLSLQKDALIFRQGTKAAGVFLVSWGRVRLTAVSTGVAAETVVAAGGMVELPAVVADRPFSGTAMLLEDGELVFVPRQRLMQLIHNDPLVCLHLCRALRGEDKDF